MTAILTSLLLGMTAPPSGVVVLNDDTTRPAASTIPANEDWFSLTLAKRPAWPEGPQALLANGNHIAATIATGDETSLTLRTEFGTTTALLKIPFSALDVVWLRESDGERARWLETRKSDLVKLATGEVLSGDIEGFKNKNLTLKANGVSRTLPFAVIDAIAFNPALTVRKPLRGTRYNLVTASGTRLTARELTADATNISLVTSFDAKVTLPWSEVATITRWSDSVIPLSDLKPRVTVVPFGTLTWPPQDNRSAKHQPLRLRTEAGIETFDSGLGTHPRTTLVYDLAGKYRTFAATLGLDADTGRGGAAIVRVLVDDSVVAIPNLDPLTHPQAIRVDLTRAKTLTLITDFGPRGDVQADVNWVEARLLK